MSVTINNNWIYKSKAELRAEALNTLAKAKEIENLKKLKK